MNTPISAERMALAYRLLDAMQYDSFRKNMESTMPEGASLMFAGVEQKDVRRVAAEAWATHLTDQELIQLAEFFETPIGQKYFETMPRVALATRAVFKGSRPEMLKELQRMVDRGPTHER